MTDTGSKSFNGALALAPLRRRLHITSSGPHASDGPPGHGTQGGTLGRGRAAGHGPRIARRLRFHREAPPAVGPNRGRGRSEGDAWPGADTRARSRRGMTDIPLSGDG